MAIKKKKNRWWVPRIARGPSFANLSSSAFLPFVSKAYSGVLLKSFMLQSWFQLTWVNKMHPQPEQAASSPSPAFPSFAWSRAFRGAGKGYIAELLEGKSCSGQVSFFKI